MFKFSVVTLSLVHNLSNILGQEYDLQAQVYRDYWTFHLASQGISATSG